MSYFDDHEDEIVFGGHRSRSRSTPYLMRCTFCGARNLHFDDGYLVTQHGEIHKCPAKQASEDDFKPL